jgi:diamine N-acetyltransferase
VRLERRDVVRDHVAALIRLAVRDDQCGLVAPNVRTLAEAAYEPGARVWGLWCDDAPVGLMAMVDPAGVRANGPFLDPEAAYLWRLMIAADRQGRGFGSQALAMAAASARDWGARRLVVGVSETPQGNLGFYTRHGFRDSGTVEDGDRLFLLDLAVRE